MNNYRAVVEFVLSWCKLNSEDVETLSFD
jgi:hypothetical protein